MASLYQDIRGALQVRAAMTPGFPPANQIAYENVIFSSTTGVPYARMKLMPLSGRAFSVSAKRKQHVGIFLVDLFYPLNTDGTGKVELLADVLKSYFQPGQHLPIGVDTLIIDYSDRKDGIPGEWFMVPVTIGWRVFSSRN